MKTNIQGVGVALVTPFTNEGEVDYAALEALVNYVIAGGVDYLVPLGTTAETPTLTTEEKRDIFQTVLKTNAGRLPIVVGIGGNNTAAVVAEIQKFDFTGVTALLSTAPYYNKPTQEGLYQHYQAIADAAPVGVVMYNIPGRTGVNMSAQTTLRLAEHPNIIGIKEASGDLLQMAYILRDCPKDFAVISGDDNLAVPLVNIGGVGVISVAANAYPKKFTGMVHAALAGKTAEAAETHLQMIEPVDALFAEGNPVGIKAALTHCGILKNNVRLPLVASSEALSQRIGALIQKYKLS